MLFLVNPFQTFKFRVLIVMSNIAFKTTPSQTSVMIECYWLKITPATQTPNRSLNGGFASPSSAGASLCALCCKEVGERENARGRQWEEGKEARGLPPFLSSHRTPPGDPNVLEGVRPAFIFRLATSN